MNFGAAYYPEHWPQARWETDADMMKEAGFNVVRMAEFAWTKMEPAEGVYDFAWLDRAIELLASRAIKSILGTPTAAPPKWLVDKHPDIYPVDYKGHVKGYGHRRYYCFNNRNYHHYAGMITRKLAEHYGHNSEVIGWQIDNELGCVDTVRCFCPNCRKEFQTWLRNKYRNIGELNERWGTVFSNQTYGSFEEVILPGYGPITLHNPGLELDFRRFSSDSAVKFQRLQANILREYTTGQTITTNTIEQFTHIDYFDLTADLDVASLDIYPNNLPAIPPDPCEPAFVFDQMRGMKNRNFWILELQSGPPGGDVLRKTPKPGELRRWTYQSIAHGADTITYFRWRTCLFGLEEFWHGILDHSGLPNRRYGEVKNVGRELRQLQGLIEDSTGGAQAAIVYSYDLEWVFEIQPQIRDYSYTRHVMKYYGYFYRHNIPVDIVSMDSDLSSYKLLVIPNLIMAKDGFAEKIRKCVETGSFVVMDYRTGAKFWDNRMVPLPLPGLFRDLLGITVEEYGILTKEEYTGLLYKKNGEEQNGKAYKGCGWYDVIRAEGAEILARYADDYFAGKPAVTRNCYGAGKAYYIGTDAEKGLIEVIMEEICEILGLKPLLGIDAAGVEVVRRLKDKNAYYFIINHNSRDVRLNLIGKALDLLTGRQIQGETELGPNDVLILR